MCGMREATMKKGADDFRMLMVACVTRPTVRAAVLSV